MMQINLCYFDILIWYPQLYLGETIRAFKMVQRTQLKLQPYLGQSEVPSVLCWVGSKILSFSSLLKSKIKRNRLQIQCRIFSPV